MPTRPRFDETLDELLGAGTLTNEQVEKLRTATRLPLNATELVAIFGGLLVVVGGLWILGPLLEDANLLAISGGLYVLGGLLTVFTRALGRKPNFANANGVVEILAVVAFAVATGVLAAQFDLKSEIATLCAAILAVVYGWWRSTRSRFAGAVVLSVSAIVADAAAMASIDANEDFVKPSFVIVGLVLMWWARRGMVNGKFVLRLAGSTVFTIGVMVPSSYPGAEFISAVVGVIVAVLGFVYGVRNLYAEVALIIGVGLIVAVVKLLNVITDNTMVQGGATLATGVVVLVVALRKLRHRD